MTNIHIEVSCAANPLASTHRLLSNCLFSIILGTLVLWQDVSRAHGPLEFPNPIASFNLSSEVELLKFAPRLFGVPALESAAATVHNGSVFITGGYLPNGRRSPNFFKSDNFFNFSDPLPLGVPARNGHCSLSVGNQLYIIGGYSGKRFLNDVNIYNGVNFEKVADAEWEARGFMGCMSFGDGVVVFGGTSKSGALGDVWYSEDLIKWRLISNSFPKRSMFSYFKRPDGGVIVVGGGIYDTRYQDNIKIDYNDVVSSVDFVNWITEGKKIYPPRRFSGFGLLDSLMITVGGFSNYGSINGATNIKSILYSADGVTWSSFQEVSDFRSRHAPIVYYRDNLLFVLNGNDGTVFNDFWVIRKRHQN